MFDLSGRVALVTGAGWRIQAGDPAATGVRGLVDATLKGHEKSLYAGWIHSPTVASSDPVETILAFKIGRLLHYPGSRVLKALRAQPGLDPAMVRSIETFVAAEPNLEFEWQGDVRRIRLRNDESR